MRIPGFAVEPPARGVPTGDLLHPQFITCEEELRPVCRRKCKGAPNYSQCVQRCVDKLCSETW